MDLFDLDITVAGDDAQPLTVLDANGQALVGDDGNPVTLNVLSIDSEAFTRYRYQMREKSVRNRLSNDADAIQGREIEWAAKLVTGWSSNFTFKGQALPFSLGNARVLMRNPLLRSQVEAFAGSAANFLPKSSSSSPSTPNTSSGSGGGPADQG